MRATPRFNRAPTAASGENAALIPSDRYPADVSFSPFGLAVSLAVLAPNLLMIAFPPRDPAPSVLVPWPLTWLERAGQALCLVVPAITAAGELRWWWLAPAAVALATYYGLWGRYIASGREFATLYRPLWMVPVPMAILPVVVFLSAAVWLSNGWIAAAAVVLAAGHVPASALIARAIER